MKKTVLIGVTGSIAAYKMANVCSMLVKQQLDVHVILTKNGAEFITPTTFETITGNKCLVDTFDRNFTFDVTHISLAKRADVLLIAPASANIMAKLAYGIADDMLTTTVLACRCPKLLAPAMNSRMYENPVVRDNWTKLQGYGYQEISPATGRLACGDQGVGKLAGEEEILAAVLEALAAQETQSQSTPEDSPLPQDFAGKKVLVTAGATQESLDPVRYLTNHSTGKMGYALAQAARDRGAQVVLISGKTQLPPPEGLEFISVTSAEEMFQGVKAVKDWDILLKAAAVADYRPAQVSVEKMKKKEGELFLALERTPDILAYMGQHRRPGQYICGFSMETENMIPNSREKLRRKSLDMIVANNLKEPGAGFAGDSNIVTLITKDQEIPLELLSKYQVAQRILDHILQDM